MVTQAEASGLWVSQSARENLVTVAMLHGAHTPAHPQTSLTRRYRGQAPVGLFRGGALRQHSSSLTCDVFIKLNKLV